MRQEKIWDADTAQRYDTPGTGMFAPGTLEPTVDRLAHLAGDGAALEFAIGTGRVAVPLAERGVPVTGIELSVPMVEQLRTKTDEATIPVIIGDMATTVVPARTASSISSTTRSRTCSPRPSRSSVSATPPVISRPADGS